MPAAFTAPRPIKIGRSAWPDCKLRLTADAEFFCLALDSSRGVAFMSKSSTDFHQAFFLLSCCSIDRWNSAFDESSRHQGFCQAILKNNFAGCEKEISRHVDKLVPQ